MNVTVQGKKQSDQTYTTRCPTCGTTFTFLENEGVFVVVSGIGVVAISCPIDGTGIAVARVPVVLPT